MLDRPALCSGCILNDKAYGYAPSIGSNTSPLAFLGESLGAEEARLGQPFVGPAGATFNRLLNRTGIDRDGVKISNCLRCQPPNNKIDRTYYKYAALSTCKKNYLDADLESWIAASPPKRVLVPLGGIAIRQILDPAASYSVQDFHGYVIRSPCDRFWVVPTYHPSHIQRGAWNLFGVATHDLQVAARIAQEGFSRSVVSLVIDPDPAWFSAWVDQFLLALRHNPESLWLAVDIETPDKQVKTDEGELSVKKDRSFEIIRVNVAHSTEEGITVPFQEPFITILKRLLASTGPKLFWNSSYDMPRLKYHDVALGGESLDFMWAWHVLQSDLPRGLGFVAPFYCLAAGERVRLWNGKSIKVSDLVTTKANVEVLGCDDSGAPIPLKITNWFRAENPGQQWLAIKVSNAPQTLHCTPEHKVWTLDANWLQAKIIRVGDRVPIHRAGNNSLIHGTLLGDGCVGEGGYLSFSHAEKDAGWTRAKAAVFAPEWKRKGGPLVRAITTSGYAPSRQVMCGVSVGRWWRDRFYTPEGKLFIPPPDNKAVAVWYGDDGCLARVSKTYNPRIYTAGFVGGYRGPLAWAEAEYGVGNVSVYGKGTHAECIAFIGKAAAEFFAEISKWLHPSMQRKLPPEYHGRYIDWMKPRFQWGTVESVEPWTPTKWHRRRDIRYCIEVDHPTHRYFTSGGLVSNSDQAPWKHLSGEDFGFYSAMDAVQTVRVSHGIARDLHAKGMWDIFWRHIHLRDTYCMRPAEEVGILVDPAELHALDERLDAEHARITAEIQALVPEEIKPLVPKAGLVNRPEGEENIVERKELRIVRVCRGCEAVQVPTRHRCKVEGAVPRVETAEVLVARYYRRENFNVGSWQQILAYIKFKKHPVPKSKKTGQDTTEKEGIQALFKKTKDPVYDLILDDRAVTKVSSTYVKGSLIKLATDPRSIADGRLHSTFAPKASTLRDSSSAPNLQNVVADRG